MKTFFRGGVLFAAFFLFGHISKAQTQFELFCPAGTTSYQPLQTFDTSTGKWRQNYCIDVNGNVTENSTVNAASGGGVNPITFGAKFDVKGLPDCSWTTGTQTVICPDAIFSGQDIGKIMFGTRSTSQVNPNALTNSLDFAQGTITGLISTTSVTVSTTAAATCPDGTHPNCNFFWGTQDDTPFIQLAENAAWNTPGLCKALQIPSGWAFIKLDSGLFNGPVGNACATATSGPAFSDIISVGPAMYGQGQQASKLVILPTSVFTGCTFGFLGTSCLGTAPNLQAHDFSIDGGQNPGSGTHANILWESIGANGGGTCDGGSTVWNAAFSGFGLNITNLIGFQAGRLECNDPYFYNNNVTMFGSTTCSFIPENTLNLVGMFCFGGHGLAMTVSGIGGLGTGHVLNTSNSAFYSSLQSGGSVIDLTVPLTWNSNGDHVINANVSSTQFSLIREDAAGTFNFHNLTAALPNTTLATTALLFANASGAINHFDHSSLTATGTNNQLFLTVAGSVIANDGGNTFLNGTVANSINGTAYASTTESGTVTCAASAATITFKGIYLNNPIVVIQDRTTAGVVTQTSLTNLTEVVACPGATDVLLYTVTPNII